MRCARQYLPGAALLVIASLAALAETPSPRFEAEVLAVSSHEEIAQWVQWTPEQRAALYEPVRRIRPYQKIYLPFVVTDYEPGPEGVALSVDFAFYGPGGNLLAHVQEWARINQADPRVAGIVVMNPVLDLTFDDGDPPGTYRIQATISSPYYATTAEVELMLE